MHIAILLRGQIRRNKSANSYFNHEFIYIKTLNSFKENIQNSLNRLNITYDLYGSVKGSLEEIDNENFIKDYKFKECKFNKDSTQFDDILTGLNMIKKSNIKYDIILITRIDLLYKKKFEELDYNKNKFNFCWTEPVSDKWICDNLYIFPLKYLDILIILYINNKKLFGEKYFGQCIISNAIIRIIGSQNINYIFKNKYLSCTNWNNKACNNPLYIIYGYDYTFDKIYD